MFAEANITTKSPFVVFTLLEFLENGKKVRGAEKVAKDLLGALTAEQYVLISYIDRELVESIASTDQWLERL